MFQTITYASLAVVAVAIVIHALVRRSPKGDAKPAASGSWSFLAPGISWLDRLKRLAGLLAVLCLVALFLTGFGQRLFLGEAIHGYTLMAHVAFAAPFVICLTFAALTWAWRCRLTDEDWACISRKLHCQSCETSADFGWKISFWIVAFLTIPASLSIILMMYPIIGTHGQHTLFEIHRYTSLALTVAAIAHIYLFLRARK